MINFKEIRSSSHLKKLIEKFGKNLDGIRFAVNPSKILKFRSD